MDFKKFPFDTQTYDISNEAFIFNNQQLIFKNPNLYLEVAQKSHLSQDWKFIRKCILKYEYKDYPNIK